MRAFHLKKILLSLLLIVGGLPLLILGLLILFFYVDNTGILVSYDNYVFQRRLKSELYSGKEEIRLKDLTDFEWDKVCLYPPYSYDEELKGAIIDDYYYNLQYIKDGVEIKVFPVTRNLFISREKEFLENLQSFCFNNSGTIIMDNDQILTIKG